jgi:aspartyl-tRNA(Asn)/glutamyl-tRNA(Gln) amidotransferase subunit A
VSPALWAEPIEALAPRIRGKALSPVELTQACLDRIGQVDDRLLSFICLAPDALEQARGAEAEIARGDWRGPLHGIPLGIKDNYLTADMPTTAGTTAPGITFPRRDAAAVTRLRRAGAVLIGKTRTHEFAWGNVTPPVRNPWALDRVPSGSSGGSGAAVAAGLCAAAMGSDTGGSIRMPAAACGVVGLKATFGRVSREGIVPHSWSLDHAGPLTRTVGDAALMMGVLAGHDPADPTCRDEPVPDYTAALGAPIAGLRIGVCRNHFFEENQEDVQRAVEAAIADLAGQGATVVDFTIPNLAYGLAAIFAIELASSTAYHDVSLRAGRVRHYTPDVRQLVELGRFVTGPDYLKAEQPRAVLMEDFRRALDRRGRDRRADHPDHRVEGGRMDGPHRRPRRERARRLVALHVPVQSDRAARDLDPVRVRSAGSAHRATGRGPSVRRGDGAARRARLRAHPRVEGSGPRTVSPRPDRRERGR